MKNPYIIPAAMISAAILSASFIGQKPIKEANKIETVPIKMDPLKKLGEPIEKRIITYSDAVNDVGLFVVHEREMWKLTWKCPYKSGEVHPAYDIRVRGGVKYENLFIHGQDGYSNGEVIYGETNFMAQGDELVTIYVMPNSQFEIANNKVKIDLEVFAQNF